MTIDKAQLKALAEAATKGDRQLYESRTINPMGVMAIPIAIPSQMVVLCNVLGSFSPLHDSYVGIASYRKDAEFIAAADPATILALLDEITELHDTLSLVKDEDLKWKALRDQEAEIDKLKSEKESLQSAIYAMADLAASSESGPAEKESLLQIQQIAEKAYEHRKGRLIALERAATAEQERDQIKAERELLQRAGESLKDDVVKLKAENEALRKDAESWRKQHANS